MRQLWLAVSSHWSSWHWHRSAAAALRQRSTVFFFTQNHWNMQYARNVTLLSKLLMVIYMGAWIGLIYLTFSNPSSSLSFFSSLKVVTCTIMISLQLSRTCLNCTLRLSSTLCHPWSLCFFWLATIYNLIFKYSMGKYEAKIPIFYVFKAHLRLINCIIFFLFLCFFSSYICRILPFRKKIFSLKSTKGDLAIKWNWRSC